VRTFLRYRIQTSVAVHLLSKRRYCFIDQIRIKVKQKPNQNSSIKNLSKYLDHLPKSKRDQPACPDENNGESIENNTPAITDHRISINPLKEVIHLKRLFVVVLMKVVKSIICSQYNRLCNLIPLAQATLKNVQQV